MGEVSDDYVGPIEGEWAIDVANRGVDPREIEDRWAASERLLGAGDRLYEAMDLLSTSLGVGLEAWRDTRADVAARQAEFDQLLAAFRDRVAEARRYAGGV